MTPQVIEVDRDFTTRGNTVELLAKVDGKRIRFVYPDRETAHKAYRKLRRNGAEFMDVHEKPSRWLSAPIARDEKGTTW